MPPLSAEERKEYYSPLPPEVLANALTDTVHREMGKPWPENIAEKSKLPWEDQDAAPRWRDEAAAKLAELESDKELPISRENSRFALQLIDEICDAETPMPWIVPGYDGELMLSWESGDVYVEFYIVKPNRVEAWRQTPETKGDGGEELIFVDDFSLAADWLKALPPK